MMDLGLWMFPALFLLIILGFPIAFSMMSVALVFGYLRFDDAVVFQLVSKVYDVSGNYVLGAIPLFIFMGAMLERSGIAERLFDAIHLWTRRIPGGLGVGAVVMATIFAAASGVAGATEIVVGMLAIPPMVKHAYDNRLIAGTICAGGSLGTMIPPSITVLVLAPIANLPVGDLFAGIMLPGILMSGMFILYIIVNSWVGPNRASRRLIQDEGPALSVFAILSMTVLALLPPAALIFMVLGTILMGWATPTEAAACGAFGSFLLALMHGQITWKVMVSSLYSTLKITAMIMLIILAGNMFAGVFYASGGMHAIQGVLDQYGLAGWPAIVAILVLTFLGGFILDLISVVLLVIPVAMPLVKLYGIDPQWFCILFLVTLQTAYITPPMAPSIFYMRAIAPPSITLMDMYRGVIPFIVLELMVLAMVVVFPQLATWLPQVIYGYK
ncbi:C4-dicarboxylate ABC transporter permease [Hoeflea sp. BAL378]|uniref:TRAP transporter large permease n=1 Tax=Hoeflea sp. BAL378 TaxID=1547437 RepID=UPI000513DBEE|nr:TRAP transporter large permease subunit [Hoeflea sp. BAL378]KGF69368.1 C4-dicarboxylate ABC transporter permease [Hoeflea sp. BAL378]